MNTTIRTSMFFCLAIILTTRLIHAEEQPAQKRKKDDTIESRINLSCPGNYKHHLQGVCVSDDAIFWSFTTTLVKTDHSGKVLAKVPVANHHGDLCHHNGKIFVAVNLGKFNDPNGNADSWVYVYNASNMKEIARHAVSEVFHGAGGIGFYRGNFFVVGGLPDNVPENYVYEYDADFEFVKKHTIHSGHTHLGIQTAALVNGHWWFGCYGEPKITLVTNTEFKLLGRFEQDCSLGVAQNNDHRMLVASGTCRPEIGCSGKLQSAIASPTQGFSLQK